MKKKKNSFWFCTKDICTISRKRLILAALLSISTLSISKRYKLLEEMGQNIQERAK